MSFICPDCKRESFNPNDEKYRYCGACHKFFDTPFINEEGFIKMDALSSMNPAMVAAHAVLHMRLMQIKYEYPEAYEEAKKRFQEELECMSSQRSSERHENWHAKLLRVWRRFASRMSRRSS